MGRCLVNDSYYDWFYMFSFLFAVMHRAGLRVHNIVLLKVLNPLKLRNAFFIANKIYKVFFSWIGHINTVGECILNLSHKVTI